MKNAVHDLRADAVYRVELKGIRSKKALLEALASGLKLPKHFGHNWDALADCLMDDVWAKAPAITVLLLDSSGASKRLAEDWQTLHDVLDEAAQWWGQRSKPFHVVLV